MTNQPNRRQKFRKPTFLFFILALIVSQFSSTAIRPAQAFTPDLSIANAIGLHNNVVGL